MQQQAEEQLSQHHHDAVQSAPRKLPPGSKKRPAAFKAFAGHCVAAVLAKLAWSAAFKLVHV
jgi:hypothetical protein